MAKSVKEQQEGATTAKPATASAYADFAEAMANNPLLAQSTAAMAAATAVGMSIAGQFAGAFFGALQGALEAQNRLTGSPERGTEQPQAPEPKEAVSVPSAAAPDGTPKAKRKAAAGETAEGRVKPKAKTTANSAVKRPASRSGKTKAAARRAAKPDAGDDLKQIAGIGPKLEKVLNENGITRLGQVAAWGEADIAKFDQVLGLDGRIARDDWVGQASKLAK
nr:5' DNA nuclease [Rhizobium sp. Q54]